LMTRRIKNYADSLAQLVGGSVGDRVADDGNGL
jgi:hypothetical protein